MTTESNPPLRRVELKRVYLKQTEQTQADNAKLLDEAGNIVRDDHGNIVYVKGK